MMDDTARLNHLDREQDPSDSDSGVTERLDHWLASLVHRYGSDLLLVEGAPPCIRKDGEVRKIENAVLDGGDIEAAVIPALSQHALRLFREHGVADSSYRIPGLGRFRINLHRERSRPAAAIRALPAKSPPCVSSTFHRRLKTSPAFLAASYSSAAPPVPANPQPWRL